jgi:choline dehydrogenase-like flavoprotein
MPKVITGNLNAPVMMMAEKIADRIVGRTPLAPSDAVYYRTGSVSEGGQGAARGRDPDALRRARRPSGEADA